MHSVLLGIQLALALVVMAPAGYAAIYCSLRLAGVLAVGAEGWHAGDVSVGGRVVLTPLGTFSVFQPLLRCESALVRRMRAAFGRTPKEQGVSDVVVEVVPMG